ncbi:hypothetical protein [Hyphomicrobium sp.]|uniref:hypothetical protein n=1 Tax=Hyphomicrobium sp. TaxID=82 RepID=UPI0025B962CB|nr:hypothetical protein [Hyphomicrobium sp.]MCC7252611.1 hypothetical protein [Hyphomicrobium sp.]
MHTLTTLIVLAAVVSAVGGLIALINFVIARYSDDMAAIVAVCVITFLVLAWFALTESISRDLGWGGVSQMTSWSPRQTLMAASLAIGISGLVTNYLTQRPPPGPGESPADRSPPPAEPKEGASLVGTVVRTLTSPGAGALQCVISVVGFVWPILSEILPR